MAPGKMKTRQEVADEERERLARKTADLQVGSKKLKEHLCNSIAAVGSLFQIWDINGDGLITPTEFRQAVDVLGVSVSPQVCDSVFQEFDPDGSGTVSSTEFLQFALRDKLARSATRVMTFFQSVDADGSGEVNCDEFAAAIEKMGFEFPRVHIDAIFNTMDADGSGSLSFKELHKQLRQGSSIKLSKRLRVGGAGKIRTTTTERFTYDKNDVVYRDAEGRTAPVRPQPRPVTAPVPPPQLDALLRQSTELPRSMFTLNKDNEFRLSSRGSMLPASLPRPTTAVWPGGGGGPRSPAGRFNGFAARGLVVCDEKRRRTIQDEHCDLARDRMREHGGHDVLYKCKAVNSYSGPKWVEPLPGIDQGSGRPLLCASAIRRSTGVPTARSKNFYSSIGAL